jgi:hypothetical protein
LCKIRNVRLVSRREVNKTCEMRGDGVKSGNVVQTQLTECRLKNFNSRCCIGSISRNWIRRRVRSGGINGFDDFVNLGRNERI